MAVITGGGSGIGAAAARRFAAEGARVLIAGRTLEKLERTADQAADRLPDGAELGSYRADVSEPSDMQHLYDEVDRRWGRLDIVLAHAGINGVWAPIEELTADEWAQTIRINLNGTFHTIKYAVPLLKRGGGGAILITSSINGTRKFSDVGSTAYSASKAAQISIMQNLALELAEHGIRVNAICPGSIATSIGEHMEMRDTRAAKQVADYRHGGIPLTGGRPGRPEDVAELALFLVSPRAAHITGSPVWIDGGQALVQA